MRTTNASKSIVPRVLAAGLLLCAAALAGCSLFTGTADIAVSVTDALSGATIDRASVSLDAHGETAVEAGVHWFLHVAVGSHTLSVTASGYETFSEDLTVQADVPQTVDVQLTPEATGTIHGVVRCVCGKGLSGISVFLDGQQMATTDFDGSYSFEAPVGQHMVTAGAPDATGAASQSVTVVEGGELQVDLVS